MIIMLGNKEVMAKNISKYMKEKNVDRIRLSKDLKLKYTTVSDWINAKTYPRIDKIELLANYFGVTKADLVEEETYQPTTVAAHFDGELDDLDQEEMQKVLEYVKFLKSQHK